MRANSPAERLFNGPLGFSFRYTPMTGKCLLIQQPAIDFNTFLTVGNQITGRSLSAASDSSRRTLSDTERFLSCLAAFGSDAHLLMQVSFSMLVIADDRDLRDVLELCAGMPFVTGETISRGIDGAVVHGTLAQWRAAVIAGMQPTVEVNVRLIFTQMLTCFEQADLGAIWSDCKRKSTQVGYYLEDKR